MRLLLWGIEGHDYTLNEKGYPRFNYDFQGDKSILQLRGLKYWGWLVHNGVVTRIADATSDSQTAKARNSITKYVKPNPVIGMIRFEPDSMESLIKSKLTKMIRAEEVKVYMADSEQACEAAYKAMLDKAEALGISKLETYGNKAYKKLRSQYEKIKDNAQ